MHIAKIISALLFCFGLSATTFAEEREPPEVTVDGMHRVEGTTMALVYAKPDVDLSKYNRIYLVKPKVAFTKNWLRTQNSIPNQRVTNEDMQRIKTELADLFVDVFKQELQNNGGYVLVDGAAEDVLVVYPAILDLDVLSPDTPGTRGARAIIPSAGSMSLYMELMDSVSGDKLVKVLDNKYDRSRARAAAPNKIRNNAAARNMLGAWAELLRKALDEARMIVSE